MNTYAISSYRPDAVHSGGAVVIEFVAMPARSQKAVAQKGRHAADVDPDAPLLGVATCSFS